ncbi:4-hydroxy-tetrahydrodipicolinate reductase [Lactococcus formosensis]|uniref:4-hydroxy-tetrahydrodipicolinate reductase n=1 Tax=Lactococcus formosensis TaxID=1281486 RepID=UPI0039F70937
MKVLQIGTGTMGGLLVSELKKEHELTVVSLTKDIPEEKFDVVIDFSHPENLNNLAEYLKKYPTATVIATTGFDDIQKATIDHLSEKMPVLFSGNFSIGVILMNRLVKEMTYILSDSFDIEIIEKHHNKKIDAPSGTAKMLLDSINETLNYKVVHGRSGIKPREKKEIGVHAVRGGTIVGEHEVIFAGRDELLTIKHEALSKMIFVKGAITGMNWLIHQESGMYSMEEVLFGKDGVN